MKSIERGLAVASVDDEQILDLTEVWSLQALEQQDGIDCNRSGPAVERECRAEERCSQPVDDGFLWRGLSLQQNSKIGTI